MSLAPKKSKLPSAVRQALIHQLETYRPCSCGIHVCGIEGDGNGFITIANIVAETPAQARTIFDAAKAEAEAKGDEPMDYVVDLNLDSDNRHVEDFPLSHQMLERCLAAARAAR